MPWQPALSDMENKDKTVIMIKFVRALWWTKYVTATLFTNLRIYLRYFCTEMSRYLSADLYASTDTSVMS